jgi:di/tricarboxylate transporter
MEHYHIYIVSGVIIAMVTLLILDKVRPVITFLGGIVILLLTGVLEAKEALHGFANEQLAIIVLLLIISSILGRLNFLNQLFNAGVGRSSNSSSFVAKLSGMVGISSAFLNNTPLVAMLLHPVRKWARKKGVSPSKILIPLSYASILGGCLTLIGTSTNLIVNGMAKDYGVSLALFDFTFVGGIMFVLGFIYLVFAHKKLPNREVILTRNKRFERDYLLETQVKKGSPIIDKSIQEADLRNLNGVYLGQIIRDDNLISPVSSEEIIQEGDILLFSGDANNISDITHPKFGLTLPKTCLDYDYHDQLNEVVISQNSALAGKTLKDSDFRARFDAAVIAIHRNGEKMSGKIGELELKPGDILLLATGSDFLSRNENSQDFYLISNQNNKEEEISNWKGLSVFFGLILSIVLTYANVPLINSLSCLLIFTLLIGAANAEQVKNAIDFDLIIIIALGLALGSAMINSGMAQLAAKKIAIFVPQSAEMVLGFSFLLTTILAGLITSKAAVAVTLPVCMLLANSYGIDSKAVVLAVAFGGAANFLTPIGYQTNLMVYGPGGYKFKDFLIFGLPLTILYCLVCVYGLKFQFEL